jgi:hypothetical protein
MKAILIILISLTIGVQAQMTETEYREIFTAIAKVESSLNPKALNKKEDARGIVQIRKLYLADANAYLKQKIKHESCYNVTISYIVFKAYMKKYKAKTFEECARLHNAGPNWRKKIKATNGYWKKVKKNFK